MKRFHIGNRNLPQFYIELRQAIAFHGEDVRKSGLDADEFGTEFFLLTRPELQIVASLYKGCGDLNEAIKTAEKTIP